MDNSLASAMMLIDCLIDNEDYQNGLPRVQIANVIKGWIACDAIPGSTGHFGFEPTNPVPVNGTVGELAYRSCLETLNGDRLLFHRIGAIEKVDVFEAVTFSGDVWYVFFLDMYHPRRSRQAPAGFSIAKEPRPFSGFHTFCKDLPYDLLKAKCETSELHRLAYIPFH
ncbi:MAG: hypothetical protein ABI547_05860 [Betaproteobacteria bacterium]